MTDDGPNHYQYREREWLKRRYHDDEWSIREIASDAGVDERTVRRQMDRHSIQRGGRGSGISGLAYRLSQADPNEVVSSD